MKRRRLHTVKKGRLRDCAGGNLPTTQKEDSHEYHTFSQKETAHEAHQ